MKIDRYNIKDKNEKEDNKIGKEIGKKTIKIIKIIIITKEKDMKDKKEIEDEKESKIIISMIIDIIIKEELPENKNR
jgi:hypothetical protein